MSSIKLHSGKRYDFISPKPEMIDIHDITHNLTTEHRFGNCLAKDWTVLQHVLLVHFLVEYAGGSNEECYCALHHDDPEAYLKDMPTPIKRLLRDYQKFYTKCALVIETKFNISLSILDLPDLVETFDKTVMEIEDVLLGSTTSHWHDYNLSKFKRLDDCMNQALSDKINSLYTAKGYQLQQEYLLIHNNLKEKLGI